MRALGIIIFSVWFLEGTFYLAQADTSSSYDIEQDKQHGNCRVWAQVDMMTDEVSRHLSCAEETLTDETMISFSDWGNGAIKLNVSKGAMFYTESHIPVAIRIDKGLVIRKMGQWDFNNMRATVPLLQDQLQDLLNDLAQGQRVIIRVGTERGNIILQGSAAAIKDFRKRVNVQK